MQADVPIDRDAAKLRAGIARNLRRAPGLQAQPPPRSATDPAVRDGDAPSLLGFFCSCAGLGDRSTTTSTRIPSETYQYSIARPIRSMTPNTPQHPLGLFSTTTRIGCCCPTVASAPTRSRIIDGAAVRIGARIGRGEERHMAQVARSHRHLTGRGRRIETRARAERCASLEHSPVRSPVSDSPDQVRNSPRPTTPGTWDSSRTEPRSATSAISRTATTVDQVLLVRDRERRHADRRGLHAALAGRSNRSRHRARLGRRREP